MAWNLGIVASSGGASAIPAEVLIVNGGYGSQYAGSTSYVTDYCEYVTAYHTSGGAGGYFGNGAVEIPIGQSVPVTIGGVGGGTSSFNGLSYNAAGFTKNDNWTNAAGYWAVFAAWSCDFFVEYLAGGGNSATSTNRVNSNINGAPATAVSAFNNVEVSGGGGGYSTASYNSTGQPVTGGNGGGTFGMGRRNGSGGTAGGVVIKYPNSYPLPSSGTFTSVNTGGYYYVTCSSTTTLNWGS